MRRLGSLAAELGWPLEQLASMPADEIEELQIVSEAYQDWMMAKIKEETHGSNHD